MQLGIWHVEGEGQVLLEDRPGPALARFALPVFPAGDEGLVRQGQPDATGNREDVLVVAEKLLGFRGRGPETTEDRFLKLPGHDASLI